MPSKKTSKKSTSKKTSSTKGAKKKSGKKSRGTKIPKLSSNTILTKAKTVAGKLLQGAAAGAIRGAVDESAKLAGLTPESEGRNRAK